MLKVQKKDGRIEDFDKAKIIGALERVGVESGEAQKVAAQVEVWAQAAAAGGAISTLAIRGKVLSLIPPKAVQAYEEFEKTKH